VTPLEHLKMQNNQTKSRQSYPRHDQCTRSVNSWTGYKAM